MQLLNWYNHRLWFNMIHYAIADKIIDFLGHFVPDINILINCYGSILIGVFSFPNITNTLDQKSSIILIYLRAILWSEQTQASLVWSKIAEQVSKIFNNQLIIGKEDMLTYTILLSLHHDYFIHSERIFQIYRPTDKLFKNIRLLRIRWVGRTYYLISGMTTWTICTNWEK